MQGSTEKDPQAVADTADGISATPIPPDKNLQYVFSNNAGLSLVVDRVGAVDLIDQDATVGEHVLLGGDTYDVTAPFLLTGIELPTNGEVFKDDVETVTTDEFSGQGSIFKPATHYEFLQAGFSLVSRKALDDFDQDVVEREADNFLLLEVRPGKVDRRFRDELKDHFSIGADSAVSDPVGLLSEIDNGIRTDNDSFKSTHQVNLFADIILSKVADLDLMASDVKGVNDFGYGNYLAKIAPLLGGLDDLKGVPGITDQLVDDIRVAFTGFDGTIVDFNPTVNVDALRALGLTNGKVADPIAFIKALGVSSNLDSTLSDVNALANTIVGMGAPAQAIIDTDLSSFDFLDDKDTVREKANQILKTSLDLARTERFLFAAGDVDGERPQETGVSVHRFFISPGLQGYEKGITTKDGKLVATGKTVALGTRAFLREETAAGLDLADSGLFLVNLPYTEGLGKDRPIGQVLHADFGLKGKKSTISVTLGKVTENTKMENGHLSRDVEIDGRTLGSTRADPKKTSIFITSPLFSTAAGGGNPLLNKPGHAGYFVLENFEPGGVEKPLGGEPQRYALLRLSTATGPLPLGTRSQTTFQGYVRRPGRV